MKPSLCFTPSLLKYFIQKNFSDLFFSRISGWTKIKCLYIICQLNPRNLNLLFNGPTYFYMYVIYDATLKYPEVCNI